MLYDLYVGSTSDHKAHTHELSDGWDLKKFVSYAATDHSVRVQDVFGVWEGVPEATAQYTAEFPDDATAQRVAYALASLTGNDAVLVTRLVRAQDEHPAFNSVRRFRVEPKTQNHGNRTILSDYSEWITNGDGGEYAPGVALTHNVRGAYVAYLVNDNATISAIA